MLVKEIYSEYQTIQLYSDCSPTSYDSISLPKNKEKGPTLYQNCLDAVSSKYLKTYHDKQRPFKTRQNSVGRKILLFLVLFILISFFTINSLIDSNVFQTDLV